MNSLVENDFQPFPGQCFLSEEEAFIFYKKKGRFITKNGEVKRRDFFCHREGKTPLKIVDPSKEQRNRLSLKCGCQAHMRIKLRKSSDIFPQEWHVTTFVVDHNHELLSPSETRFLPSNRTITEKDEKHILMLKEGGLSVRQIMRVIELEKHVKHGYLSFLEKDVRNLFTKVRKKQDANDAMDLLQYCKIAKEEDCKFQYVFTLDEERKLEHIFWSAAHCIDWYQKYGDVVVFDTTYKINAYQMPFRIFVGVNNHGKTILFGCALLRNETTSTFRWLMKVTYYLII
ncbi:hypothetical protein RHGRI_030489 [Rhododendron griersonianum]|uniref:Protein FAR1-RELATED SEQUENCE n=1 Tax=Rhododendron griersonianum TaxID=479676 RepID=A0AAV6IRM5_9ERIC|nr:hypothetical protein RHGRI_030489 [Rhododendron griersonianum]